MTEALIDNKTDGLLRAIASKWEPSCPVVEITAITPDASKRRYYRLHLGNEYQPGCREIVAMVFDSTAAAEVVGQCDVGADDAYVQLSKFFSENDIRVPKLLYDARELAVLLVEDVGGRALGDVLPELDDDTALGFYQSAIDQILAIQKIPPHPNLFAFQRAFNQDLYVREMREFTEFLLPTRNCPAQSFSLCISFFDFLAEELCKLPLVLCHRDFHSWNLMIDKMGAVRVIDFQDALLGTPYYDVASLINDRDTDSLLGPDLCADLLDYFFKQSAFHSVDDFARALLQRDLKVAGRFAKLGQNGKPQYEQWIEGTVARIGRMLLRLASTKGNNPIYGLVYEELRRYLPEIA